MEQTIKKYFEDYPDSNECYAVDEYLFHEKEKAEVYAQTLKDKPIVPHKRESYSQTENEKKGKASKPSK